MEQTDSEIKWWQMVTREAALILFVGLSIVLGSLSLADVQRQKHKNQEPDKSEEENIWLHGLQELGFSMMEAGVVIALIEVRSAREQIKRSTELIEKATKQTGILIEQSLQKGSEQTRLAIENLFDSVYRQQVPKPIVRLYEDTAFRCHFFRTQHEYECTFHDDPQKPAPEGMIWITFDQSFVMHNQSQEDRDFLLECETEVLPQSQLPNEEGAKCGFTHFEVDGVDMLADSKTGIEDKRSYKAHVLSRSVQIPVGGRKKFEITFKNLRRLDDFEVVVANYPSDGMELRLAYPAWLETSVVELHPQKLTYRNPNEYSAKWKLDAGILVGQGVCLQWKRK